jgi:integrase
LGPQAQAVVKPFLKPDTSAYLFVPIVRAGKDRGHYDRRSYRQAIVRACERAFPHPTLETVKGKDLSAEQRAELKAWRREHHWTPLQLRHTAATAIRKRYGIEASQVVLGHARADVTQVYAERDTGKARAIMAEIG